MIRPLTPPSATVTRNSLPHVAFQRYTVDGLRLYTDANRVPVSGSYLTLRSSALPYSARNVIALGGEPLIPRYWTSTRKGSVMKSAEFVDMPNTFDLSPGAFGRNPRT